MRRIDREMPPEFGWQVVDKCAYAVLSMVDGGGKPYAVPLSLVRSGESVYFHCAKQGEKTDCLRLNPDVCVVCVGDVQLLPQEFSAEYESAILRGVAHEVTDREEKVLALRLISERYAAENMAEFDAMVDGFLAATGVWRIDVCEITAKRRKNDANGVEMKFGRME